jgi:urease accessory protein
VAIATLPTTQTPTWAAELELSFARRESTTVIERRRHRGPLLVQRAFHPEADGTCHVYVLHPPGGVAGGDELSIRADVLEGAAALLTTPAATKLYRTRGAGSKLQQTFHVRSGASLEWLPQETLAFGGSNVVAATSVNLDAGASYIGWEITCLGRPASGDHFEKGSFRQCTEIRRGGELVLVDRTHVNADGSARSAAWGWAGRSVYATLVASATSQALVTELRASVAPARPGDVFAVTALSGLTVCRWLGSSAEQARRALSAAWRILRRELMGKPACPPRIWTT